MDYADFRESLNTDLMDYSDFTDLDNMEKA